MPRLRTGQQEFQHATYSDEDSARWLDVALLERLATEKMKPPAAETAASCGLAFVRPTPESWAIHRVERVSNLSALFHVPPYEEGAQRSGRETLERREPQMRLAEQLSPLLNERLRQDGENDHDKIGDR